MAGYIVARFVQAVGSVIGASLVVFLMINLSGDPTLFMLPQDATREQIAAQRRALGLDKPLAVRYLIFFRGLLRGDFGISIRQREPALKLVLERLPATAELTIASLAVAAPVGIITGVLSAVRRNTAVDNAILSASLSALAMPTFWLGLMFILIFSVGLGLFPTGGRGSLAHLVLPALTLGGFFGARLTRLTRSVMLDVLAADYLRTARAKGLRERTVLVRHGLRNAALPIVTVLGIELGTLMGGAVVTETVFAWPGIGRLAVQSVFARDFPVVEAAILFGVLVSILSTLITDMLYIWLDPRVRFA